MYQFVNMTFSHINERFCIVWPSKEGVLQGVYDLEEGTKMADDILADIQVRTMRKDNNLVCMLVQNEVVNKEAELISEGL